MDSCGLVVANSGILGVPWALTILKTDDHAYVIGTSGLNDLSCQGVKLGTLVKRALLVETR